jgi:hypothetical protein
MIHTLLHLNVVNTMTDCKQLDIACYGLPEVGMWKHPGKFYLQIIVDGKMQQTSVAEKTNNPTWDDTISL